MASNRSSIRSAMPRFTGEATSPSAATRPTPAPPSMVSSATLELLPRTSASIVARTAAIASAILSVESPLITAFRSSIASTVLVTAVMLSTSSGSAFASTSAWASASSALNVGMKFVRVGSAAFMSNTPIALKAPTMSLAPEPTI